jgi:hypothetical protein
MQGGVFMNGYAITGMLFTALIFLVPAGSTAVTVSTVSGLSDAVADANSGGDRRIFIASGTYHLNGVFFRITADNVTIAGATGTREDVVLDGDYQTTEIFQLAGSSITIKDLTLKQAYFHPIHIFPDNHDVSGILITNVHIIDPGQQAIKINQDGAKRYSANNGTIQRSAIELTESGRARVWQINSSCYTGGIDAHHAEGWTVRDNTITGFWCSGGLSEHAIHFWSFSEDTVVERNRIVNCDRGIGFGLGSSGHRGGIIRNNMIYHDTGHSYSDVGIGLESATGVQVYNNTIYQEHGYPNAIEYRFSATDNVVLSNNLTNRSIASRDGGTAILTRNVTTARADWFTSVAAGDLHLASPLAAVVDRGVAVSGLRDDFDREPRPMGKGIDIGADEWTVREGVQRSAQPWLQLLLDE